jgi:hypothetical protein
MNWLYVLTYSNQPTYVTHLACSWTPRTGIQQLGGHAFCICISAGSASRAFMTDFEEDDSAGDARMRRLER